MDYLPRIGTGYDLHRLAPGRKLIIGGVEIPHDRGLLGHSDADVLVHALIDAILGAIAAGDIGRLFPDNDPVYKDADSMKLLGQVRELLEEKKGKYLIANIDSTVIAQQPKLAPYIETIRTSIASALGIALDRVSVKAKTNENVDATGREEAIAAHCSVLILEQYR